MFQKNRASLQTFVPEAFVPEIFWGIGWDLREREVGDRKWVIEHFKSFSDPTRSHVLKGYDAHGTLLSELRRITDKEIDH